jgi:hypothetical protein
MSATFASRCLTRVMIDDDSGVEVAQLQSILHRIQCTLRDVPQAQREYIANALLNLAVSRMWGGARSLTAGGDNL